MTSAASHEASRGSTTSSSGALELSFEVLELPDTGLTIYGYVADAGSRSEEQLRLLADWTAPQHPEEPDSAITPAEHEAP